MSALDTLADKAKAASERLAREGGIKAKLGEELAEDAEFLRKLKPELIRKRARGEAPTDESPNGRPTAPLPMPRPEAADERRVEPTPTPTPPRAAHAKPKRTKAPRPASGGGPNPLLVLGAALVLGVVAAKVIDWRGHAHPRW